MRVDDIGWYDEVSEEEYIQALHVVFFDNWDVSLDEPGPLGEYMLWHHCRTYDSLKETLDNARLAEDCMNMGRDSEIYMCEGCEVEAPPEAVTLYRMLTM